jgi:hypothetical protein
MSKEKVTLTLDADALAELRALVGSRSLSSAMNAALTAHVAHLKHLAAVDDWLRELEEKHGPIPPEALSWAAQVVREWEADLPTQRAEPPARRAQAS